MARVSALSSILLAPLATALLSTACGSTPKPNTNGTPDGGATGTADPAYWGLADKTCLRFDDGTHFTPYLDTIEISLDTNAVRGTPLYRLLYRSGGQETRNDWFEVKPDSLVWHWHNDVQTGVGTPTTYFKFAPPPTFLEKGLTDTPVDSTTTAAVSDAAGGSHSETDVIHLARVSDTTVTVAGTAVPAVEYIISRKATAGGTTDLTDLIWFAPNQGIVQLRFAGAQNNLTLAKTEPVTAKDTCIPQ